VDDRLDPLLESTTVHEDPTSTDLAFEADVSAYTYHSPLVTAAGVRLAQSHQVVDLNVMDHDVAPRSPGAGLCALLRRPPALCSSGLDGW